MQNPDYLNLGFGFLSLVSLAMVAENINRGVLSLPAVLTFICLLLLWAFASLERKSRQ